MKIIGIDPGLSGAIAILENRLIGVAQTGTHKLVWV